MATKMTGLFSKAVWVGVAVSALLGFSLPSLAQGLKSGSQGAQDNPFSALVGDRRARRADRSSRSMIERYVLASDDRAFLFEDYGAEARVKFLCGPADERLECNIDSAGPSPEIYLLTPTRAPRGDVIYKNAEGEMLLRIASYGGATVYWPGELQGQGASKSFGDNHSLALPTMSYETASRRAKGATAIVSATTGAPTVFELEAPLELDGDASVLADAIVTTAKGLCAVAEDPTGARIIASRISKVVFLRDQAPGVSLNGRTLEIRYVPGRDIRGRVSSAAVAQYLEESL